MEDVSALFPQAVSKPTEKELWLPGGKTLEEFKKNYGLEEGDLEQVKRNMKRINQLVNKVRRGVEVSKLHGLKFTVYALWKDDRLIQSTEGEVMELTSQSLRQLSKSMRETRRDETRSRPR